jgi:hypothetical protein
MHRLLYSYHLNVEGHKNVALTTEWEPPTSQEVGSMELWIAIQNGTLWRKMSGEPSQLEDQMKNNEIGLTCNMHQGSRKYIQMFCWKASKDDIKMDHRCGDMNWI